MQRSCRRRHLQPRAGHRHRRRLRPPPAATPRARRGRTLMQPPAAGSHKGECCAHSLQPHTTLGKIFPPWLLGCRRWTEKSGASSQRLKHAISSPESPRERKTFSHLPCTESRFSQRQHKQDRASCQLCLGLGQEEEWRSFGAATARAASAGRCSCERRVFAPQPWPQRQRWQQHPGPHTPAGDGAHLIHLRSCLRLQTSVPPALIYPTLTYPTLI